jgi:hypothetical protein
MRLPNDPARFASKAEFEAAHEKWRKGRRSLKEEMAGLGRTREGLKRELGAWEELVGEGKE